MTIMYQVVSIRHVVMGSGYVTKDESIESFTDYVEAVKHYQATKSWYAGDTYTSNDIDTPKDIDTSSEDWYAGLSVPFSFLNGNREYCELQFKIVRTDMDTMMFRQKWYDFLTGITENTLFDVHERTSPYHLFVSDNNIHFIVFVTNDKKIFVSDVTMYSLEPDDIKAAAASLNAANDIIEKLNKEFNQ